MTSSHAAREQLASEPVTIATDVARNAALRALLGRRSLVEKHSSAATPADLAPDIRHFQEDRPVLVPPGSLAHRV